MKKLKSNTKIKKIVEYGLLEKAPIGMMDRVMANLAVSSARRLSIKPVEPKPIIAVLLPFLMIVFLALAVWLKPTSILPKSWNLAFDFTINPAWIAPIIVTAIAVWAYIVIENRRVAKT